MTEITHLATMADVADVLGLSGRPAKKSGKGSSSSSGPAAAERPQGLAREVFALVDHTSLPSMVRRLRRKEWEVLPWLGV